ATQAGNLEIATLLLAAGADSGPARWSDQEGCTPLHLATMKEDLEMVKLLLYRAPIESHGHYGTPLAFAVRCNRLDVVKLLLDRGADASV
ncbi:ankyrin repeat protein, partial [Mycena polygramma]